jgi:hypothetical protein
VWAERTTHANMQAKTAAMPTRKMQATMGERPDNCWSASRFPSSEGETCSPGTPGKERRGACREDTRDEHMYLVRHDVQADDGQEIHRGVIDQGVCLRLSVRAEQGRQWSHLNALKDEHAPRVSSSESAPHVVRHVPMET